MSNKCLRCGNTIWSSECIQCGLWKCVICDTKNYYTVRCVKKGCRGINPKLAILNPEKVKGDNGSNACWINTSMYATVAFKEVMNLHKIFKNNIEWDDIESDFTSRFIKKTKQEMEYSRHKMEDYNDIWNILKKSVSPEYIHKWGNILYKDMFTYITRNKQVDTDAEKLGDLGAAIGSMQLFAHVLLYNWNYLRHHIPVQVNQYPINDNENVEASHVFHKSKDHIDKSDYKPDKMSTIFIIQGVLSITKEEFDRGAEKTPNVFHWVVWVRSDLNDKKKWKYFDANGGLQDQERELNLECEPGYIYTCVFVDFETEIFIDNDKYLRTMKEELKTIKLNDTKERIKDVSKEIKNSIDKLKNLQIFKDEELSNIISNDNPSSVELEQAQNNIKQLIINKLTKLDFDKDAIGNNFNKEGKEIDNNKKLSLFIKLIQIKRYIEIDKSKNLPKTLSDVDEEWDNIFIGSIDTPIDENMIKYIQKYPETLKDSTFERIFYKYSKSLLEKSKIKWDDIKEGLNISARNGTSSWVSGIVDDKGDDGLFLIEKYGNRIYIDKNDIVDEDIVKIPSFKVTK